MNNDLCVLIRAKSCSRIGAITTIILTQMNHVFGLEQLRMNCTQFNFVRGSGCFITATCNAIQSAKEHSQQCNTVNHITHAVNHTLQSVI